MIRLTEVGRHGKAVDVRIEGHLTEHDLLVLEQELDRYHMDGFLEVRLLADGLLSVTPRIGADQNWPAGLIVRFTTRRGTLYRLLVNYNLDAQHLS